MAIKAQLPGVESVRVPRSAQLAATVRACPDCHSASGEFCRIVLSEPGTVPMRLGGYLPPAGSHPARLAHYETTATRPVVGLTAMLEETREPTVPD